MERDKQPRNIKMVVMAATFSNSGDIAGLYQELRRLASYYMEKERTGHTLQPTALVHEAWLKLAGSGEHTWQDRTHFFAAAAQAMRAILVDHARARNTAKRGGAREQVELDEAIPLSDAQIDQVLGVDQALSRLAEVEPQQARVVEMRYFGGLSVEEVAAVLGISERTVKRDWSDAKVWLYAELGAGRE